MKLVRDQRRGHGRLSRVGLGREVVRALVRRGGLGLRESIGLGTEKSLRQYEDGLHTAVDIGLKPYRDAVSAGERGDDEQADPAVLQHMGDIHLVGVGEQGVHLVLFGGGHTEATVLDLDGEPGRDVLGAHQHLGVRGGEQRGVLDQFGQQVDHVGDGVAAQGAVDRRYQFDSRVLLHLCDGRSEHLGHGDRVGPLPAGDGAAEYGEVLGVSADAGGQVVDVEEALEQLGILDLVLQLVEQLDLAVDQ